jgi:predicted alpha/beta-hydrolase family hydrolase
MQILLAHGAGAGKDSPWMQRWAAGLSAIAPVTVFDYSYQTAGKPAPKAETLLQEHFSRFEPLLATGPAVLIGKSMGSRVGCHVAAALHELSSHADALRAVVCLGYPLRGQNGKLRDEVLSEVPVPMLLVSGSRDPMCDLTELDRVAAKVNAIKGRRLQVLRVEGGDHSLTLRKMDLKARGESVTQSDVEAGVLEEIRRFIAAAGSTSGARARSAGPGSRAAASGAAAAASSKRGAVGRTGAAGAGAAGASAAGASAAGASAAGAGGADGPRSTGRGSKRGSSSSARKPKLSEGKGAAAAKPTATAAVKPAAAGRSVSRQRRSPAAPTSAGAVAGASGSVPAAATEPVSGRKRTRSARVSTSALPDATAGREPALAERGTKKPRGRL